MKRLIVFILIITMFSGCKDTVSSLWPVFTIIALPTAWGFFTAYRQSRSGSFKTLPKTGEYIDFKSNMKIWETPNFKLACIGLVILIGAIIWANLEK